MEAIQERSLEENMKKGWIRSWCLVSIFLIAVVHLESASGENTKGSVIGVVLDIKTYEPLSGVNVIIEGGLRGTTTDQNGEFIISDISVGSYILTFDHIGYAKIRTLGVEIKNAETTDLRIIYLKEEPIPLNEIVVNPGAYSMMGSEPSIRKTLSSDDIKIMGWAEDVTRAVQRIPGTTSDEYSAKFNIRGGDADEVLVQLDGMRIYQPFHQKDFGGGLFSTVDIEMIESVDLLTGGFPAEYGEKMGGVLNMKTKTSKNGQRESSVGFSLMNARAFFLGPLSKKGGSYLFSARRGYLDLLNRLMNNEFKLNPAYYDIFGKMEYDLNGDHTLSIHGFLADDSYTMDEKIQEPNTTWTNVDSVDTGYGNRYGWITLKSNLAPWIFARTMLYGGEVTKKRYWRQYDLDPQWHLNSAVLDDNRDFRLFGFRQDWDVQVTSDILVGLGGDIKRSNVSFDYSKDILNEFITNEDSLTEQSEYFSADRSVNSNQIGLYLTGRVKIFSPLALEAGIRYDGADHTNDKVWSPRFGLVFSPANATFIRAGWGRYRQIQEIDDLDIQFEDLTYHTAERTDQIVLGFEHIFRDGLHFRAEAYQKKMTNLRDEYYSFRDIDEFFPEARDDLIQLKLNEAHAKGLEFLLKHDTGNMLSWWLSYVLSEATDDVADIVYGGSLEKRTGTLPRAWDQTHTLNLDANYRLNEKWQFNFAWKYRTGWPNTDFTVKRLQRPEGTWAYYHDRGEFRGTRVPSYQRLDARVNRHFYTSKGKISVFLQIINLYNHENVIRYDHDILEQNADTFKAEISPEAWFGITPFIGLSWEF